MTVSIVIPVYNHYDLLHQMLFALYKKCAKVDEVVIFNDASTDEDVYGGLTWWKSNGMLTIREIRARENRGFLQSANRGLRKAVGDMKILLSTDVYIHRDLVTPVVNTLIAFPQDLVGGVRYDHDTGWNTFGKKTFPYLEGWLLSATKETWEELGYFDERYAPNDFEDVDLSTTALSQGRHLYALNHEIVQHMGGRSIGYNEKREELTKINQRKFKEKWIKTKSKS